MEGLVAGAGAGPQADADARVAKLELALLKGLGTPLAQAAKGKSGTPNVAIRLQAIVQLGRALAALEVHPPPLCSAGLRRMCVCEKGHGHQGQCHSLWVCPPLSSHRTVPWRTSP